MNLKDELAGLAGKALRSVHAGSDQLSGRRFPRDVPTLTLTSPWFEDGGALPERATKDGAGEPPPLQWSEPPPETRELVLIVEDPDAPKPEPFVHWLVYDISAEARSLDAESVKHAREGKNSLLASSFTPAAPPPGHGVHHYHFQLFALDAPLALEKDETKGKLLEQMTGHVIARGELTGTYERRPA